MTRKPPEALAGPVSAPRRRARKVRTEARREQLAQVALEIVGARGFGSLSMGEVAEGAGIVPSGVYKHFGSRDELVEAVVELIGESLRKNLEASCKESDDALECLRKLLALHAGLIRTQGVPRIVFSDEVYLGRPERKRKLYGYLEEYLRGIAAVVRNGQESGLLRADRDPNAAAVLFLGLVQPAGVLWHLSDGAFALEDHLREAWEAFATWLAAGTTGRTPEARGGE